MYCLSNRDVGQRSLASLFGRGVSTPIVAVAFAVGTSSVALAPPSNAAEGGQAIAYVSGNWERPEPTGQVAGYYPSARQTLDGDAGWLDTLNWYRAASGLPPVTENVSWSAGIEAHLAYLANTPAQYRGGEYANAHVENPASPFYTPEGDAAGRTSNLTFHSEGDQAAINIWMAAPFHAIGVLRPGLKEVAFYRNPATGAAGLDVVRGFEPTFKSDLVLFPGPGTTIDLQSFLGESPNPLETCGYNASAGLALVAMLPTNPGPEVTATITDVTGRVVPSCIVSEHTYVSTDPVYGPTGLSLLKADTLFIVPRDALRSSRYTANLTQPGQADISWSFNVAGNGGVGTNLGGNGNDMVFAPNGPD